jgi:DNA-binding transcriptional LysR family regulator
MRTEWGNEARTTLNTLAQDYEPSMAGFKALMDAYAGHEVGDPERIANLIVMLASREAEPARLVLTQACIAGLGIALLPQLMIDPIIAQGKLVRILPTWRRTSSELGLQLVYTSRPPVPPAVAVFAEYLLEKLGDVMTFPSRNVAS